MAECFCGCGKRVPRFPLGTRSVNKRGARHRDDVASVQKWLDLGVESPNAEAYIAECEDVMEALAAGIHGRYEPSSATEAQSRKLLAEARTRFTDSAVNRALNLAVAEQGASVDDLALALRRGEFDPFE